MSEHKALDNAVKTDAGVQVNGVLIQPAVEQCNGCERIRDFDSRNFCSSYPRPQAKWSAGNCNFATHTVREKGSQAKVNPLQASNRAAKGKK
jgi:hypothetical protein